MADPETLEEGDIFFLYRPTVDTEHPHDLSEVQHLYVVLRPRGGGGGSDGGGGLRLLVVGKKRLPTHGDSDRNWGFVDRIGTGAEIEADLREAHYETKTAGPRTQGAARPAGEGAYALARAGSDVHLRYALALPETPGPVQQALGIAEHAAFAITVKNPHAPASGGAGGRGRAAGMLERHDPGYSAEEQALFAGNRWAPADPRLLDHRGAEFLLIAAHDDAELVAQAAAGEAEAHSFTRLKLARTRHPVEPLFTGEWA